MKLKLCRIECVAPSLVTLFWALDYWSHRHLVSTEKLECVLVQNIHGRIYATIVVNENLRDMGVILAKLPEYMVTRYTEMFGMTKEEAIKEVNPTLTYLEKEAPAPAPVKIPS